MPYRDDFKRLCGPLALKDQNSEWTAKLCILDEEKCLLRYFSEYAFCPKGEKLWNRPEGEINLRFITKIEEKGTSIEDSYCFEIQMFDAKKHYLKAESEDEMQGWIKNLHRVTVDPSRRQEGIATQPMKDSQQKVQEVTSPCQEEADATNDKSSEHVSYETKIIGGVVVRKPVIKKSDSDSESDSQSDRTLSNGGTTGRGIRVIKDGYLTKKGAVVKNWKRRYFKLDLVKLSYYEKETDKEPIRSISTVDITGVRINTIFEGKPRENLFEVVTPHRTFSIQADSKEDMTSWVESLSVVITSIRGRSASGPL